MALGQKTLALHAPCSHFMAPSKNTIALHDARSDWRGGLISNMSLGILAKRIIVFVCIALGLAYNVIALHDAWVVWRCELGSHLSLGLWRGESFSAQRSVLS